MEEALVDNSQEVVDNTAAQPQDNDPLLSVWKALKSKNPNLPDFNTFKTDMQHNEKAFRQVHAVLKTKNKDLPEFDQFTTDMFGEDPFKKKVSTKPSKDGGTVGASATPSTKSIEPAKDFATSTPTTPDVPAAPQEVMGPKEPNPYSVTITETPVRPSAPILPSDVERMNLSKDIDKVKTAMKWDEKAGPFRDAAYTQKKFDEFKAKGFSDAAIEQGMADADKSYIEKSQAEAIPDIHAKEIAEAKARLPELKKQGFNPDNVETSDADKWQMEADKINKEVLLASETNPALKKWLDQNKSAPTGDVQSIDISPLDTSTPKGKEAAKLVDKLMVALDKRDQAMLNPKKSALDKAAEEIVQNNRDQFAVGRLSPDDRQIYALNTQIDAIAQKPKPTADDRIKLADLKEQASVLKANGSKYLYDPKTGQMVGKDQASKEAIQYSEGVDKLAEQYTYKQNLDQLRNEAYDKVKYFDNLLETSKKVQEDISQRMFSGYDQSQHDEMTAAKSREESLKNMRIDALMKYDALNKAIMLNENPGTIREGGLQQFKDRFTHAAAKEIPFFTGDNSSDLTTKDYYQGMRDLLTAKSADMVPKEMKDEYKDSFMGELGSATGGIVGIMPKLVAMEVATDGVGGLVKLPEAIASLKRSASVLDKLSAFVIESGIESAKFAAVGIDPKAAPGFVLPGYLGKYRFSVNPTGKIGAIIAPFIASSLEKGLYGTAAMEAGGVTESVGAALANNHDISTEIQKRFGDNISDFTKKVIIDFAANTLVAMPGSLKTVATSPFSTPEALRKAADELDDKSKQVYAEYQDKRANNNGEMPKAEAKEYADRIYDNARSADEMRKRADALEQSVFGKKKVDNSYEDVTPEAAPADNGKPKSPPPSSPAEEVTKEGEFFKNVNGIDIHEVNKGALYILYKPDGTEYSRTQRLPDAEAIANEYSAKTPTDEEVNAAADELKVDENANPALKDVESTAKALEGVSKVKPNVSITFINKQGYDQKVNLNDTYEFTQPEEAGFVGETIKGFRNQNNTGIIPFSEVAEAYHKAKADGSNPELVKAVEEYFTNKGGQDAIQKPSTESVGAHPTGNESTGGQGKGEGVGTGNELQPSSQESAPGSSQVQKGEEVKPFAPEGYKSWLTPDKTEHENEKGVVFKIGDTVSYDGKSLGKITGFDGKFAFTESKNNSDDKRPTNTDVLEKITAKPEAATEGTTPNTSQDEKGNKQADQGRQEGQLLKPEGQQNPSTNEGSPTSIDKGEKDSAIPKIHSNLPKGGDIKGVTEIKYEDEGKTLLYGTKTNKVRMSILTASGEMTPDEIKDEIDFIKDMVKRSEKDIEDFPRVLKELESSRTTSKDDIDFAIKRNKEAIKNVEQDIKLVIPFYENNLKSKQNEQGSTSVQQTPSVDTSGENPEPNPESIEASGEAAITKAETATTDAEKETAVKDIDKAISDIDKHVNGPAEPPPSEPKQEAPPKQKKAKEKTAEEQKIDDEIADIVNRMKNRRKGRLSSGIDPEDLADAVLIMVKMFRKGLRKLSEIAKDFYEEYGEETLRDLWDAIKDGYSSAYNRAEDAFADQMTDPREIRKFDLEKLIKEIKDEEAKAEEEARKTPENFVAKIKEDIRDGTIHNKASLEKLGREYGLTDATKIKELAELAVVERGREIVNQENVPEKEKFDQLLDLYYTQPNLTHRSSNSIDLQQYSTPVPYSYLAGLFVGLDKGATGFESTAGNGMLTVASSNPKVIVVNEIDPDRLENLHKQGFKVVLARDAATAKPFPELDKTKQAVLANPPFGKLDQQTTKDGFIIRKLEHQIIANTLDAMKDDAKASFIVGGHNEYDEKGRLRVDLPFYNWLYSHYNVKDVINVDGDLYKKQGTSYPTRLILIDGRKAVVEGQAPADNKEKNVPVKTWDELYNRVKRAQNSVSYENILQPGVDAGSEPSGDLRGGSSDTDISGSDNPVPSGQSGGSGGKGGSRRGKSRGTSPRLPGQQPGTEPAGSEGDSAGDNGERSDVAGDRGSSEPSAGESETSGSNEPKSSEPSTRGDDALKALRESTDELLNGESQKIPYKPFSKNYTVGTVVPVTMAYNTVKALQKIEKEHGDIDQWVADELGYKDQAELFSKLSGEQIDGVALALNNIKKGQAAIIGDQTGIGKGRIAAAIIRYAHKNKAKPIFVTFDSDLFSDLYRDLHAIGSEKLIPFFVNDDKNVTDEDGKVVYRSASKAAKAPIFRSGVFPANHDYILASYSQFQASEATAKKQFMRNISDGSIMILDESHNAGGDSNRGEFFQDCVRSAKGVTFLSATYAKKPENMPLYALKTVMQEANSNDSDLIAAIEAGGVVLQEIVSSELVASGQMIRRERTFDGVPFEFKVLHDLKDQHSDSVDKVTDITRELINFQNTFIQPLLGQMDGEAFEQGGGKVAQRRGTNDAGISNTPFANKLFNLVDQLLFSVKADAVADEAIAALKRGEKPFIAFKSTMGAFVKDMEIKPGDTLTHSDFSATLLRSFNGILSYTETTPGGDKIKREIDPETLPPEAFAEFKRIRDKILAASSGMSISPVDVIINKIEKAGYTVGEVTGRNLQFKEQKDGSLLAVARRDKDKKKVFRGFNNLNEKGKPWYNPLVPEGKPEFDVIMANAKGSTGVSAHSSKDFTDQRQRTMIIHQVQLDIDLMMQMLGRIFRTGQVNLPKYQFVSSAIPAEMRLMMMLMKKMSSLSANTTSDQSGNDEILNQEDFLNKYGDEIVQRFLIENPELNEMILDPLKLRFLSEAEKEEKAIVPDAASMATGKVAILPSKMQAEFYAEILNRYNDHINYLNEIDENDLKATSMPLQAETIASQVAVEGRGGESSFGGDSVLERVEANILKKPFSKAQIEKEISEQLDGETPEQQQERIRDEVLNAVDEKYVSDTNALNKKYADKIEALQVKNPTPEQEADIAANTLMYQNELAQKLEALRYQFDAKRNQLSNSLKEFRPGRVVSVPLSSANPMLGSAPGIVVGFRINKNSNNPYTPSSIKVRIVLGDSRQAMTIPLSKQVDISGIISATYMQQRPQNLLENWDSTRSNKARGERYIVTGNVLQAFSKPEFRGGKVIKYTTKDGDLKQGILMPEHYNQTVNTTNPIVVRPIINMLPQIKEFKSGDSVTTVNQEMTIRMDGRTGMYRVEVPRAKSVGGNVYLDPEIRDLVSNRNFDSYGTNMVGFVAKSDIESFVRTVQRKFAYSVNAPNEKSIDQQIRDQHKNVRDAENDNSDGGPSVSMNPIPTKKQARLMYEYGKLAWLYLKKGMSKVADFLRNVGERFSEFAVKAWNKAKDEFERDKIAVRLDNMKFSKDKVYGLLPPFNLFPGIWNTSIDIIKNKILSTSRTPLDIEKAIDDGLTHAKNELAANGVAMSPAEETIYRDKMKAAFLKLAPTPSFGNPAHPPTPDEIKLSREKVRQALNPDIKNPSKLAAVKDFFANLSKHIDNPFIYVTNIESGILKEYPNAVRTSKVPLGRLFEQSFTGPAKLAVEKFRDEVLGGLSASELDSLQELIFATRVVDRLTTDPLTRATGNITLDDAIRTINDIEREVGPTVFAKLTDRGQLVQDHTNAAMDELVSGGIMSQKTRDDVRKLNEFYAPFNVVQTLFNEIGRETDNKGGGQTVLFKIKGIPKERINLTLGDLIKLQTGVDDGIITPEEFQRGAMEILDELRNNGTLSEDAYNQEVARLGNPGFKITNIYDKIAEIIYKSYVIAERNKIFLKIDQMRDVDTYQHFIKNVEGYEFRHDATGGGHMVPKPLNQIKAPEGFSVIKYKKDGKTTFVAVNTEAAKAMRGLNEFEMNGVMHLMNIANRIARYGIITYSSSFLYANSIIDNYRALTMSKYGAVAGKNIADSMLNTVILVPQMVEAMFNGLAANLVGFRSPSYESWMRSKSFKKGIFDDVFDDPKHKISAEINKTPKEKVFATLRYLLTLVPRVGTALEQMPKLYIHTRGQDIENVERLGLTAFLKGKLDAAEKLDGLELAAALDEIAYDVLNKAGSPNFSATGNWAKYMSGLFQFFGARMKGEASDWRIILNYEGGGIDKKFNAKNIAMAIFKLGAYAILPMLITAIKNIWSDVDEKSFNSVTDYDKNNNMMMKTGATFNVNGEHYMDYFKMPLRGVPATANTLVNSVVNYYKHDNPQALKNIALQLYTNATPLNLNIDFKEGEPGSERTRKVVQSVVSNMNPLIKYGYEELNNVNSFNDYSLIKETGRQGAMYRQYLQGNENVKPWDIQPHYPNKKADEISKFLYDKLGWKITSAGVDHILKVPAGNILNALDSNALSKRIYRSEEENPIKRK